MSPIDSAGAALNTLLGTGIGDPRPLDLRELRELMMLGLSRGDDVFHRNASGDERIRYQGAMAFPRHHLGAHDGGTPLSREPNEAVQSHAEFRRRHVVCVSSKPRISPAGVAAVDHRFATAAEVLEVFVINAPISKRGGEHLFGGPWDPLGCGEAADVRESFDSVSCEEFEEFLKGQRRVTDGPDHEVRISTTIHGFLLSFVLGNISGPTGSSKQRIAMAASAKDQSAMFVVESQMRECQRPLGHRAASEVLCSDWTMWSSTTKR